MEYYDSERTASKHDVNKKDRNATLVTGDRESVIWVCFALNDNLSVHNTKRISNSSIKEHNFIKVTA